MNLSIISLLLFALQAFAQAPEPVTIEGTVTRKDNILFIELTRQLIYDRQIIEQKTFELSSSRRQTQEDLNHLETGDHVIGLGKPSANKILLDDLEMVGVKRVLGSWREANQKKLFEFHDFTNVSVTESLESTPNVALNYRLMPDKKNEWTIFLSSNTAVKMGTMIYDQYNMKIELIDVNSGQVTEQYNLSLQQKK